VAGYGTDRPLLRTIGQSEASQALARFRSTTNPALPSVRDLSAVPRKIGIAESALLGSGPRSGLMPLPACWCSQAPAHPRAASADEQNAPLLMSADTRRTLSQSDPPRSPDGGRSRHDDVPERDRW
jgi:hypothetical protein